MMQLREVGMRLKSPLPVLGNLGSKFGAQGVRREVWCRSQSPSSQSNRGAALPGGSNILRRLLGENIGGDGTTSDISSTTTITTTTQKVNDLIFEEMDKVVGSLLFCPICSPQRYVYSYTQAYSFHPSPWFGSLALACVFLTCNVR